jgi:hypothetical protein
MWWLWVAREIVIASAGCGWYIHFSAEKAEILKRNNT